MSLEYRISAIDEFSDTFAKVEDGLDTIGKAGDKLKNVGSTLTKKVTVPLTGLAVGAALAGSNFEAQMSKVEAISGATGNDLDALTNVAKEMGATTRFSASESASALEYMSLAGWNAQQSVAALPGMLDLAAAGALELGTASDIMTDMMSMFSMPAEEASRAADVLAHAQANSNTNVEQLGEALKYSGATAAAAGMDLEQTASILGVLADNGLKGSSAGTALDSMFRDLRSSAVNGAVEVGNMSISLYDAEGNMRSMTDILADFETATNGMTGAQRDAALSSVFQARSMRGANILLTQGTDAVYALEQGLYGANGAAGDMANIMNDNLQGSFIAMMSALEGLAITFYEMMQPALNVAVEMITGLIRWLDGLDESTQIVILAVAAFAAALGPILFAIGVGLKLLPLMGAAIGALTSPITLIVIAVAGLVAALVYLWNTSDTFRANVTAAFEYVRDKVMAAVGSVRDFIEDQLEVIFAFWDEHGTMVMNAVENVFNVIKSVIEFVMPFVEKLIMQIWTNIKGVFSGALDVILGIIRTFSALFTGNWSEMGEGLKRIASGALKALWNLFQLWVMTNIFGVFRSFGTRILGYFKNLGSSFKNAGKGLIDMMVNGIKGAANKAINAVKDIAQNVRNMLPFSPAKDGPLSDLDKLDFAGPITHSIDAGLPQVKSAMTHMLDTEGVAEYSPQRADNTNAKGGQSSPIIVQVNAADFTDPEHVRRMAQIIGREIGFHVGGAR